MSFKLVDHGGFSVRLCFMKGSVKGSSEASNCRLDGWKQGSGDLTKWVGWGILANQTFEIDMTVEKGIIAQMIVLGRRYTYIVVRQSVKMLEPAH